MVLDKRILLLIFVVLIICGIELRSENQVSEYKKSLEARYSHTAVWTGKEMIIWGGRNNEKRFSNGAIYNPITKEWREINLIGAPYARNNHCAVWTGREMLIWGGETDYGLTNTGHRYDPAKDKWEVMSTENAPIARTSFTAVWTGSKMIIWGGLLQDNVLNDGGIYDPQTDTWTPVSTKDAPSARHWHSAVWDGKRMIIWGGFDPVNDKYLNDGGLYDPSTDSWKPINTDNAPIGRWKHLALYLNDKYGMLIWGGYNYTKRYLNSGALYNPEKDTWKSISDKNAPVGREMHTLQGVWTGKEVIVWGGLGDAGYLNDGGKYNPATDKWLPIPPSKKQEPRDMHSVIWTGKELIIWGGWNSNGALTD